MISQKHVPDNYCGGTPNWRLFVLHYVAKALGLLVKVEGFPLGTCRNYERSNDESSKP